MTSPQFALRSDLARVLESVTEHGEKIAKVEATQVGDSARLVRIEQNQDRASTQQITTMVLLILMLAGMLFQMVTGRSAESNPARAAIEAAH